MRIEYAKNIIKFENLSIGDCFHIASKDNMETTCIYMKLATSYHIREDDGSFDINTICLNSDTLHFCPLGCEIIRVDCSLQVRE